eukprot:6176216-Pleurochrysis_carterae.AAC.1
MRFATGNGKHTCVGLTHQTRRQRPNCKTYCVSVLGHLGTRKLNTELQFAQSFPHNTRLGNTTLSLKQLEACHTARSVWRSLSDSHRFGTTVKLRLGLVMRDEKGTLSVISYTSKFSVCNALQQTLLIRPMGACTLEVCMWL